MGDRSSVKKRAIRSVESCASVRTNRLLRFAYRFACRSDIKLNIEELNPVQRRIVIALKAMKRKPEFKETNFTKVLLKFTKIRKTLAKVKVRMDEIFTSSQEEQRFRQPLSTT